MVKRKQKKLLAMNARSRDILEVNVPNSNTRTNEQKIGRRLSKLLGMTPLNSKRKKNKKK